MVQSIDFYFISFYYVLWWQSEPIHTVHKYKFLPIFHKTEAQSSWCSKPYYHNKVKYIFFFIYNEWIVVIDAVTIFITAAAAQVKLNFFLTIFDPHMVVIYKGHSHFGFERARSWLCDARLVVGHFCNCGFPSHTHTFFLLGVSALVLKFVCFMPSVHTHNSILCHHCDAIH